MRRPFAAVAATPAEEGAPLAGDDLMPDPDAVMDRAFTVAATPEAVWPWIEQLGKRRAGWYLPRSVERFIPRTRRAIRHLDPRWQGLVVGEVIPDYGGPDETFEVVAIDAPRVLVYRSTRGDAEVSWAITLSGVPEGTRVHLRLRIGPLKRPWLARSVGEWFDAATIAGMAAGLAERLR